jgi:glycosyltransferase involved in cell wall biosynthesis
VTIAHSVVVANLNAPEISHLSVELARRGALHSYVRQYVNKGRLWEQSVARLPGIGAMYGRTLGRRTPPSGLPLGKVVEAGILPDFLAAVVGRMPLVPYESRRALSQALVLAAEHAVTKRAGKLASQATAVVASYGTGQRAFEVARRHGARCILSYPIANNRFQSALYAEEAMLAPEFAAALPRIDELPPRYAAQLERECELADRILVASVFARESFIKVGYDPRKIVAMPYGVDTARFSPSQTSRTDSTFRVLFVGQIGQRKGASYLFEAYEMFRKADSELHVVGSFVADQKIYSRFSHLYRHTENLPQATLPELFRAADVFVLPSLVEGMSLVALEAMACGLPIITTTHGQGEIVRHGVDGFLVPIRDPAAIAAQLELLYRDSGLRRQMGRNAREQALRHTWQAYASRAADAILGQSAG